MENGENFFCEGFTAKLLFFTWGRFFHRWRLAVLDLRWWSRLRRVVLHRQERHEFGRYSFGATAYWNSEDIKTSNFISTSRRTSLAACECHPCFVVLWVVVVHPCGFEISGLKKFRLSSELRWYKVVEIS